MMCFRLCCNREEEVEADEDGPRAGSTAASRMDDRAYQIAVAADEDDDATAELVLDNDDYSRQGCYRDDSQEEGDLQRGIYQFFRSLRAKFRKYDSLESPTEYESFSSKVDKRLSRRPALSFESSTKGVLTILSDEVVLPGSDIQKQMAKLMSEAIESQVDECVICMEAFDPSNPRMPTFCGCGANKTYFHLPCLYQWVEQSQDCPSCRQKLRWEEF